MPLTEFECLLRMRGFRDPEFMAVSSRLFIAIENEFVSTASKEEEVENGEVAASPGQ